MRKNILESQRKMKIYETGRGKKTLLGIITRGFQSANQNLKTNLAKCHFIYIITMVFVACLRRFFFISTSQSEINRYRLPQFILGKNNDSLFTPTQVLYSSMLNFQKNNL